MRTARRAAAAERHCVGGAAPAADRAGLGLAWRGGGPSSLCGRGRAGGPRSGSGGVGGQVRGGAVSGTVTQGAWGGALGVAGSRLGMVAYMSAQKIEG